ncbi:GntR family transcriptional regulator [Streptomyces sp. NBC_00696]|uniref:GntR family transcriptional regulator n=1 Tax=Streptomyces sp. NBC_00696 TaxID=2903672 RepID=UPI002E3268BC|nr:GntR family transcriptional regulator [Streptomyces sp. NBC_00696]
MEEIRRRPKGNVRRLTPGPTLSDQAYLSLREGITAGRFEPGARITERALAEELGVSPTPVREALRRLEHERLIERDAVRNIRIADPSIARLYELTLIEAALRGVAARLAAERATDAQRASIVRMCDRADAMQAAPDLETYAADLLKITRRFHELVDLASHNEHLIDMIATATAFDWAFRVKWAPQMHRTPASLRHSLDQHRIVALAVREREGDTAERAMRDHILQRTGVLLDLAAGPADEPTGS